MFIWGFGPIFKAVIATLKARIKQAEEAFANKQHQLREEFDAEVKVLEASKAAKEAAHIEEQVKNIFRGI